MCLLIVQPATSVFDIEDIKDFYAFNGDGIGVMWSEDNVLRVHKSLPQTADEAYEFYKTYCQGRECVIHFRWQTHGKIDMLNCHPYEILGDGSAMPMYMAHNGVLSSGNRADTTKSDTWHYINDYLKPILSQHPDLIYNTAFVALLEDHIGSGNKFVFMNHEGKIATVNEKVFVTYKGAKLSNTYAWTATRGGFGSSKSYNYVPGAYSGYDWDDEGYGPVSFKNYNTPKKALAISGPKEEATEADTAAEFFGLLKDMRYDEAYEKLTFVKVEACMDLCGDQIWDEFVSCIITGRMYEEDIIDCVEDPDYMIEYLYGDLEDEDEGEPVGQQKQAGFTPAHAYTEEDDKYRDLRLCVGML